MLQIKTNEMCEKIQDTMSELRRNFLNEDMDISVEEFAALKSITEVINMALDLEKERAKIITEMNRKLDELMEKVGH